MEPRTIAIGDIHGHSAALKGLLREVQPMAADTIVFLGDLINRGPDSRGVLEEVLQLSTGCKVVIVLGNHEEMLLDARKDDWAIERLLTAGGAEMLASYGANASIGEIPARHWDLLASAQPVYETDSHFFIHANYAPNFPIDQQSPNDSRWLSLDDFLPAPHYSGKRAIVGHTPQLEGRILQLDHLVCIDTGCGFGGLLTALDVHSEQIWQVNEHGNIARAN